MPSKSSLAFLKVICLSGTRNFAVCPFVNQTNGQTVQLEFDTKSAEECWMNTAYRGYIHNWKLHIRCDYSRTAIVIATMWMSYLWKWS